MVDEWDGESESDQSEGESESDQNDGESESAQSDGESESDQSSIKQLQFDDTDVELREKREEPVVLVEEYNEDANSDGSASEDSSQYDEIDVVPVQEEGQERPK